MKISKQAGNNIYRVFSKINYLVSSWSDSNFTIEQIEAWGENQLRLVKTTLSVFDEAIIKVGDFLIFHYVDEGIQVYYMPHIKTFDALDQMFGQEDLGDAVQEDWFFDQCILVGDSNYLDYGGDFERISLNLTALYFELLAGSPLITP